ncbi:MAG TPA: aspartyl/asparaginyl beta-hydroxylase domain-containing protein [Parafilimonas sp.]|nr:aspartyl/asparaginyl beta-hydroxylase domain-containing protein [Parafilimonas sp.]
METAAVLFAATRTELSIQKQNEAVPYPQIFSSFCNLTAAMHKNFLIKYARLNLRTDFDSLQIETRELIHSNAWLPHVNKKHYTGEWQVLALRSAGGNLKHIVADQMNETAFIDTALMDQLPSVKKFTANLECPVMSVRLLNLKSGAIIKPHRDFDLCFEKGEARIHLPIFTNEAVEFILDEERLLMKEGECWYINANLSHSVANYGRTDRLHLVIDCTVNEWLKNIFNEAEKVMIEEKINVHEIQKVIRELRLQNTTMSNKLADQLAEKIR